MGPYVEGFRDSLLASGYAPGSVRHLLRDMGGLGRWMDRQDIAARDLNSVAIGEFLKDLGAQGRRHLPGARSFTRLLDYLARQGVLAKAAAPSTLLE
ncbi:MAG: hypothetical protein ACRDPR_19090, partial [Nocardioidaceae bacterium]